MSTIPSIISVVSFGANPVRLRVDIAGAPQAALHLVAMHKTGTAAWVVKATISGLAATVLESPGCRAELEKAVRAYCIGHNLPEPGNPEISLQSFLPENVEAAGVIDWLAPGSAREKILRPPARNAGTKYVPQLRADSRSERRKSFPSAQKMVARFVIHLQPQPAAA